jgi:PAS domain S-box-containing protein
MNPTLHRLGSLAANPFAAAAGTIVLTAALLATIWLTHFNPQWTVFLGGMLAAAVFASASHTANARWLIARRTSQLSVARSRLAEETRRITPPKREAAASRGFELIDQALPAMLAYIDKGGVVRYHNRAYARWVGMADAQIDGQQVSLLMGPLAYATIEAPLAQAMQGTEVRYERSQTMRGGEAFRLFVQYVPHFADGEVAGCFAILTDITAAVAAVAAPAGAGASTGIADTGAPILAALERDEFCLYSQSIVSLGPAAAQTSVCEVLLRLKSEERNHLPPGSFLEIAEEHGMLPHIDRWVVRKVLDAASGAGAGRHLYMVNVTPQTIAEGTFGVFVRGELASRAVPGSVLAFEFPEADILANPRAYAEFAASLRPSGCRFAVTGFGSSSAKIDTFRQLGAHYLKIDGGLVLGLLRDPGALAKVRAINQAARDAGMLTVAECVENEVTRAALRRIGTDFAQGFGIEMPRPMVALDTGGEPNALERAAA